MLTLFICFQRAGNFFREPPPSQIEGQQPPMMSFKAFLATQDDNISDSEAIEKYNDYKLEFQRQQLNEFFVAHKDDEWYVTDKYLSLYLFSRTIPEGWCK